MPQLNEDDNVVVVPKRKMETVTGEMVHATEQDAKELKELIELSSDSDDEPQPKKLAKSTLVVDSDEDDSEDSDEDKPYHATASNRTRSFVGFIPADSEKLNYKKFSLPSTPEQEEKDVIEVSNPIGEVVDTGRDITGAAISSDGQVLVVSHHDKHHVEIYNVATKKLMHTMDHFFLDIFFVSSHLFVGRNGLGFLLIDADTGEVKHRLKESAARHFAQGYPSDGRQLAVCLEDYPNHLQVWDLKTGELRSVSYGQGAEEVSTASISPAGDFAVVTRDQDGTSIVSVNSYTVVAEGDDNEPSFVHQSEKKLDTGDHVNDVSYSPDGKYILVETDDVFVSVFDATTATRVFSFEQEYNAVFTEDSKQLVVYSSRNIIVFDIATGQEVRRRQLDNVYDHTCVVPGGRFATCTIGNSTKKICVFQI